MRNMAYATDIRTGARSGGLRGAITAYLADLADRREKAREYRRTLHELRALSDRELSDLGISRLNVEEVAYRATYGA